MADEVIDLQALQNKLNPKMIITIVVVLFLIIAGFSSYYMVDQTEQAVVLQ
ncbi:MAG: HflK protein, partial [bacterium]|nr:HflK protein [bacterium]